MLSKMKAIRFKIVLFSLFSIFLNFSVLTPSAHSTPLYAFPVPGCKVSYAHSHHNYPATDILAKVGCAFVAATTGVIDEVNRIDRWSGKTDLGKDRGGLYLSLIGDDGVRYYGSHLSKIMAGIVKGSRVSVGQKLGAIGTSGDARGTAPHLHFGISWPTRSGIWWVRRGELYPWHYLDLWRSGKDVSPAKVIKAMERKIGVVPAIPAY
jgi:murein DD-endopeptidase MepM/ murein hydrolase activator NlpD